MKKLILIITMAALLGPVPAYAGTDAAAFLKTGIGARAMGMGGAFTSIADDPTAVYWNPAGLARIGRFGISAMSQTTAGGKWDGLEDVAPSYQYFGLAWPVRALRIPLINNDSSTIGFGVISSGLGNIPLTSVNSSGEITRDTFSDTETAYLLSYALPLYKGNNDQLSAGVTLKYIKQEFSKVSEGSASGYDSGFGLLYSVNRFNMGLSLERGAQMHWETGRTDTAPMTTRFGVSNTFPLAGKLSLLGSMDIIQRQNQPITASLGTEFGYEKIFTTRALSLEGLYLRAGIDSYTLEDRYGYRDFMNNNLNFTAGFGIDVSIMGYEAQLDYVMGSYRLGDKTRFSLNLYF